MSRGSRRPSLAGTDPSEPPQRSHRSSLAGSEASEAMRSQPSRQSSKLQSDVSKTKLSQDSKHPSLSGSEASETVLSQASRQSGALRHEASGTKMSPPGNCQSLAGSDPGVSHISKHSELLPREPSRTMQSLPSRHGSEKSMSQPSRRASQAASLSQHWESNMSHGTNPDSINGGGQPQQSASTLSRQSSSNLQEGNSARGSQNASPRGSVMSASQDSLLSKQSENLQLEADQSLPLLQPEDPSEGPDDLYHHSTKDDEAVLSQKTYAGFAADSGTRDKEAEDDGASDEESDDDFPPGSLDEFSDTEDELPSEDDEDLEEDVF